MIKHVPAGGEIFSDYEEKEDESREMAPEALCSHLSGFIFGRFSAIKTKSTWQNLDFLGEKLEFFEEFGRVFIEILEF